MAGIQSNSALLDHFDRAVSHRSHFSEVEMKNPLRGAELKRWLCRRKVGVVGLGKSGIAAAQILLKLKAQIFLSECESKSKTVLPAFLRKGDAEFGRHSKKILDQDLLVVSPGVEWNLPLLSQARKKGLPVWSELEFAFRLGSFDKICAVTGTNGKTTTVSLIGEICRQAGLKTLVAGNIGEPLSNFALSRSNYDAVVLEISSYQLEGIETFRPRVAAVLNLTSDHLHRHKTMSAYAKAKERIFLNQGAGDTAVLNADDPWCRKMAPHASARTVWFSTRKAVRGVFFDPRKKIIAAQLGDSIQSFHLPTHLIGMHNVENCCAAIACGLKLGVPSSAIRRALESFEGVEHRLEKVRTIDGVTFVNDSKGTNVDSTLKALESFSQPLWLILGGEDKGAPYTPLKPLIREKVKGIFLIGEAAPKIYSQLKGSAHFFVSKTLHRAVLDSFKAAVPGDVVLLSPACASFDQFNNFEDRGNQFKSFAMELKRK